MLSAFTAVLHVPNLHKPEHLLAVVEESEAFTKKEIAAISKQLTGRRYTCLKLIIFIWQCVSKFFLFALCLHMAYNV